MRKSTSLSVTLVITSIVISIVIAYSVGAFAIVELNVAHEEANENYKVAMYDGYRTEIKSQVQAALAVLQGLYNQEIQGFITTESGIRIGLCGEVVESKNDINTIKNISSLVI